MNGARIVFYMDGRGYAPVLNWMGGLPAGAQDKIAARLALLAARGHHLGAPSVKPLRKGVHELRANWKNNQYRILFFYHPGRVVVLAHALLKKTRAVPKRDIDMALKRKVIFESNPDAHTYRTENQG